MPDLKKFLNSPFRRFKVGRDKIFKFFEDHLNRLIQAVVNGEPFASLVDPTQAAFDAFKASLGSESGTLAQKEARTISVDKVITEFKTAIKLRASNILVFFPKNHPAYQEFFPHGKVEYYRANKASIERLMAQIISAISNHKTLLGQPLLDEFLALQSAYINARNEQLQKMEDSENRTNTWETCLETMQIQAFRNLLAIASHYIGKAEKIELFFDQSIIRPRKHHNNAATKEPYTLTVSAGSTKAANISFSVNDKLFLETTGEASLFYYGAVSPNAPCPPTASELKPGNSKEVTALSLGAPVNKYLLFTNKDTSQETEVEITLLDD